MRLRGDISAPFGERYAPEGKRPVPREKIRGNRGGLRVRKTVRYSLQYTVKKTILSTSQSPALRTERRVFAKDSAPRRSGAVRARHDCAAKISVLGERFGISRTSASAAASAPLPRPSARWRSSARTAVRPPSSPTASAEPRQGSRPKACASWPVCECWDKPQTAGRCVYWNRREPGFEA